MNAVLGGAFSSMITYRDHKGVEFPRPLAACLGRVPLGGGGGFTRALGSKGS